MSPFKVTWFEGRPMKTIACLIATCLVTTAAFAHGGGLDKNGCHTNKKTGDYHCHGAPAAAPAPPSRAPSAPQATRATSAAPLSLTSQPAGRADLTEAAQTLLKELGYDVERNGILDAATISAIKSFQVSKGLLRTGHVSDVVLLNLARAVVASRCD
jgi:pyruvate/2-oxoglutarate dehydrogenase complex dihydrolipoamide acyltransferase (E2) component